jgi:3-oxoacyl-[acyl-carrier protein] reductase
MSRSERTAVITGASKGLGKKIAEVFVKNGMSVVLCARSKKELDDVVAELAKFKSNQDQEIISHALDVSDFGQVDEFARKILSKNPQINILVNNAGIHGPLGEFENNEWDEWQEAINVNLLGAVYLCKKFVPHFKKQNYGKIINLSGGGATGTLPRMSAYAISKVGLVRFTEILAVELAKYHIDVNAIAPGAMLTELNEKVLEQGAEKIGDDYYKKLKQLLDNGGTPLSQPAELALYLASSESDGITGKLISAPWDPWKKFDQHREELKNSDIYTLRRITPADRGKNWDN